MTELALPTQVCQALSRFKQTPDPRLAVELATTHALCRRKAAEYVGKNYIVDLSAVLDEAAAHVAFGQASTSGELALLWETGLEEALTAAVGGGERQTVPPYVFRRSPRLRRFPLSRGALELAGWEVDECWAGVVVRRSRKPGQLVSATWTRAVQVEEVKTYDAAYQAHARTVAASVEAHRVDRTPGQPRRKPVCSIIRGRTGTGKTYATLRRAGSAPTALFLQSHELCLEKTNEFLSLHPNGQVIYHRGVAEFLKRAGDKDLAKLVSRMTASGYSGGHIAAILGAEVRAADVRLLFWGDSLLKAFAAGQVEVDGKVTRAPVELPHDDVPTLVVATHAALRALTPTTKGPSTSKLAKDCTGRLLVVDEQPIKDLDTYHFTDPRLLPSSLSTYVWEVKSKDAQKLLDDADGDANWRREEAARSRDRTFNRLVARHNREEDDEQSQHELRRDPRPGVALPYGPAAAELVSLVRFALRSAWTSIKSLAAADPTQLDYGLTLSARTLLEAVDEEALGDRAEAWRRAVRAASSNRAAEDDPLYCRYLASPSRFPAPPRDRPDLLKTAPPRRLFAFLKALLSGDSPADGTAVFAVLSATPHKKWTGWTDLHAKQTAWDEKAAEAQAVDVDFDFDFGFDFDFDSFSPASSPRPVPPRAPQASPDLWDAFLTFEWHRGVPLGPVLRHHDFILLDATADNDVTTPALEPTHQVCFLDHLSALDGSTFVYKHVVQSTYRSTLKSAADDGHLGGTLFRRLEAALRPEAGHTRVGVIGTKATHDELVRQVKDRDGPVGTLIHLRERLGIPVEIVSGYLGNLRGTNAFVECDALVVFTDPRPNVGALERAADAAALQPSLLIEHTYKAELVQALGRARLIRRRRGLGPLSVYSVGVEPPAVFVDELGAPVETVEGSSGGRVPIPGLWLASELGVQAAGQGEGLSSTGWTVLGHALRGRDPEADLTFLSDVLKAAQGPSVEGFRRSRGELLAAWQLAICMSGIPRRRVSGFLELGRRRTPAAANALIRARWDRLVAESPADRTPRAVVGMLLRAAGAAPDASAYLTGWVRLAGARPELPLGTRAVPLPHAPPRGAAGGVWDRYWRDVAAALEGAAWVDRAGAWPGQGARAGPAARDPARPRGRGGVRRR